MNDHHDTESPEPPATLPPPAVSPMRPPPGESYQDQVIASLVESARAIREAQGALLSPDGALGKHTKAITEVIERSERRVLDQLREVHSRQDKQEGRIDTLEDQATGWTNRFATIESAVHAAQLELVRIDNLLKEMRGQHGTAGQSKPPPG